MAILDKLYILDDADNAKTIAVLDFLIKHIQHYNKLTGRKIMIFRITEAMVEQGDVIKALKRKGISSLPALEITQPKREIFEGVNEITGFCMMLIQRGAQRQQQATAMSHDGDIGMLGEPVPGMGSFYRDEILGKDQEESQEESMGNALANGHRAMMERRAGKVPARGAPPPPGGSPQSQQDNVELAELTPAPKGRPQTYDNDPTEGDSVHNSLAILQQKGGADADLDFALLEKLSGP